MPWYRLLLQHFLHLVSLVFCLHLCLTLCLALCLALPRARADTLPATLFFEDDDIGAALLSPDARALAIKLGGKGGRDRLAVFDIASGTAKVVAQFHDADLGRFEWVNNTRLLFDSRDRRLAQGEQRFGPGLYAVNRDGSGFRQLAEVSNHIVSERRGGRELLPWNTFMLDQPGAQDSDEVYVERRRYEPSGALLQVSLLRLNTVTGQSRGVAGPDQARSWLLDHKGEPRVATVHGGKATMRVMAQGDGADPAWRAIASYDGVAGHAIVPLGFGPDGTLYVVANGPGQGGALADKAALYAWDSGTGKIAAEPLVRLADYDFTGSLALGGGKLLGVHYRADAFSSAWFDPGMAAAQKSVDALLPATTNILHAGRHAATPWLLVVSSSDRQPPLYALFDRASGKLTQVGKARAGIDPARMAAQDLVRFPARDGLTIPAWLTVPDKARGKRLPLVVLVHGGPYVRGETWGWDAQTQFLASRGYAVLAPEFRGSTGFGRKHFRAGWKQWGLAMQDDLADAARWAIAQGIADPDRICIAGASYGGYAALMGVIRDPALLRCAVNWVGVTDIDLLYTGHWSAESDLSDLSRQYGMPLLVGDPVQDRAQFQATSPLVQAARLRQPVLMAYGGADRRVPPYHGRKMLAALTPHNPDVEWVMYDNEGHGWGLVATRLDFWARVEKFLHKHIGAPPP